MLPNLRKARMVKENGTKSQRAVTPKAASTTRPTAATRAASIAPRTPTSTPATPPPPAQNGEDRGEVNNGRQHRKQHARKRRKKDDAAKVDEKMRIKRRVKNMVNRIRMEQNLIDAYAGEGWKGNSREKIRPEKELQRAEMQILGCKLAIRDLIRELDNLGLEGCIKESAFDEDGQIFHEEIFCAKCKSQEAIIDNDIILCDGACDRGFHQKCLEPPLATADIPPGDEGWLCPVCDSKVECLNYINNYLATEFQVEDGWEQIFAAAAAAAEGGGASNAMGEDWPSEDSEDDDYDPQRNEVIPEKIIEERDGDDKEQKLNSLDSLSGSESEPEASSGSDASSGDEQSSGVSGDELEDTGRGRPLRRAHSSRTGRVIDAGSSDNDREATMPAKAEDDVPVSGKRHRKPVDYKKLHEEMFGKADIDDDTQSEDEEWGPGRRRRKGKPEGSIASGKAEGNGPVLGNNRVPKRSIDGQQSNGGSEPNHIQEKSSSGRQTDEGKPKGRLPESAVEILRKEFESGTCFPTKAYKELLAQKLGISFQQVVDWFKNARHASKNGTAWSTPAQKPTKDGLGASSNGILQGSKEGSGCGVTDEMEMTNGLLVEKLDEVQMKLHYLKQTLEAIVAQPNAADDESNLLGRAGDGGIFDTGIVMSHANGKRILYVPVAEVVEKDPE